MRQNQREWSHTQNGGPDHDLSSNTITHGPAHDSPHGHSEQKHKEMNLRRLDRNMEFADEEEDIVTAQARHIKELGEYEDQQNQHRPRHDTCREWGRREHVRPALLAPGHLPTFVPSAHLPQDEHTGQRDERKPG